MITDRDILDLVTGPATKMKIGKANALLRLHNPTAKQRALLEELIAREPTTTQKYIHPGHKATTNPNKKGLDAADIAWLQRLPSDPEQIPFTDAVQLASLAITVKDPSEKRLVNSVWQPVKQVHDERAGQVALANAKQPLPPVPASAADAIGDAVLDQHPDLNASEAISRGRALIQEARSRVEAELDHEVYLANQTLTELESRKAQRQAVTA